MARFPELTRREFIGSAAAASLAAPAVAHARPARADVVSVRTISYQPNLYCGWPTLVRGDGDRLVLVWSGGRERHVCPFGQVCMMTSADGGDSWTFPRVLIDSDIDDRDAGVLVTNEGSLLVTTFTSLAFEPTLAQMEKSGTGDKARLQRWVAARDRLTAEQRKAQLGTWMIRSANGGTDWSSPYRVPVNSPHGPIQLSDGRQFYAGKALWTEKDAVGVCVSADDGQTWEWLSDIPTRKGDDHRNYHELHAVQVDDQNIIVQIRNHNSKNSRETLQTESTDGGRTWTEPHSIGVWGLPSHLLKLRDGRLLMSYGYRRKPFGNQARVSEDGGKTWSEPIVVSADAAGGDLGYPSTVQLTDGSLVTVWYEKRPDSAFAVLRQANWTLNG